MEDEGVSGEVSKAEESRIRGMAASAPLRVLVVEDDLDVAAGLGDYLTMHGVDVDFAASVAQAMHVLGAASFDVLVLDAHLPDGDGFELCRRLRQQLQVNTPVLFLTAHGALDAKLRAFEAGALDYVVKPFEPAELLARVRAIAAHVVAASSTPLLTIGEWQLDLEHHLLLRGAQHLALSALAARLIEQLMRAHPGFVSRASLYEVLWQGEPPDSDPLRSHVHQLRRNLQAAFGTPLIATLRGVGYRFGDGGDGDAPE